MVWGSVEYLQFTITVGVDTILYRLANSDSKFNLLVTFCMQVLSWVALRSEPKDT